MNRPVKYLVLVASPDGPLARMFDGERRHVLDVDATSEEVTDMTAGHVPLHGALDPAWNEALGGHTREERAGAQIFTLEV